MIKLLSHQITAVEFLTKNKYTILADTMGLGKSLSAISSSLNCTNLLIVAPAYLKANWSRELIKWGFNKPFFICSYEFIASGKADIYLENSSHLILDEGHYIKNPRAKRTQKIHDLVYKYKPTNVYVLSGTPAKNRVPELYSLLMLCSIGNLETRRLMTPYFNYYKFCNTFSIATTKEIYGKKVTTFSGHKNLPVLKEIMSTCYLRRLKMEVDLPSMREIRIPLGLDNDVLSTEDYKKFMESGVVSPAMASRKAFNAIAKAPYTAKFCKEMLESEQVEQIVIFCDHITSTEEIANILKVPSISSKVPLEKRDEIVQRFLNKKIPYLVTTIGTSSTGLNLVNTHVMVFNSFPYVSGDLEQAKKRTNRFGQEKDCLYYYMIAGDIDDKILNILESKAKTLEAVL